MPLNLHEDVRLSYTQKGAEIEHLIKIKAHGKSPCLKFDFQQRS